MRKYIVLIVSVIISLNVTASVAVGEWYNHSSYHDVTMCQEAFGQVFVLSDGALFSYDSEDNSVWTYNKVSGLSDYGIQNMSYCKNEDVLLLAYSNGNLDLLYSDFSIYNITDIKNFPGSNKEVYSINTVGDMAYISSEIGLVKVDFKKRVIESHYNFDSKVNSSVIFEDCIYCCTDKGVFKGSVKDNLLDMANWRMIRKSVFNQIVVFDHNLLVTARDNKLYIIKSGSGSVKLLMDSVSNVTVSSGNMLVTKDSMLYCYDNLETWKVYKYDNSNSKHTSIHKNQYYFCQGEEGLDIYDKVEDKLVCVISHLIPNSPKNKQIHYSNFLSNGKMIAVSGYQNYTGIEYPGEVMILDNGKWSYLENKLTEYTTRKYIDLTVAVEDPAKKNHYFVGSARQGLYEFQGTKFVKLHTWDNSGLNYILANHKYDYVSVNALSYDSQGNLWMANNEIDTIIKILTPSGTWKSLYYPEIKGLPTFTSIQFDKKSNMWLCSSRWKPGLFVVDFNNTPFRSSDDKTLFIGPDFTNQDGLTETINHIFFCKIDLEETMWIGTDKGIFTITKASDILSQANGNVILRRIKIPRNDGTNLADYLFNGVYTTAICIDPANRKWIGTANDGIFLISANGLETINHFTTENSPMPSNEILSLSMDNETGSLYVGTTLGLIEYGTDCNEPSDFYSNSNIWAYPNPVLSDFDGYVSVTGLSENSTVHIISPSGKVVFSGVSQGGLFSWNCCDMKGERVPSGVYTAVAMSENGKKSVSTPITIIR